MSAPYANWHRLRAFEGATAAQIAQGKKILGALMDSLALSGLPTAVKRIHAPDGTLYIASYDGTTPVIQIVPVPQPGEVIPTGSQIWIPRGFVLYPMWQDKPFGVGLPVVIPANADQYSQKSLDPGLLRSNWTDEGPCGEVLLTPDKDSGYPQPNWPPSPLMYDEVWGPRPLSISDDLRHDTCKEASWGSIRLSLVAFPDWQQQNDTTFARTVFEDVNTQRKNHSVPLAFLPFRGFSDIAFDGADVLFHFNPLGSGQQNYPDGYADAVTRITKDGYPCDWVGTAPAVPAQFIRNAFSRGLEMSAVGAGASQCVTSWDSLTSGQLTSVDLGYETQLHVSSVQNYRLAYWTGMDRWIQAGNVSWKGSADGLPPLSWHGFASVNLAFETWPVSINISNPTPVTLVPNLAFLASNGDTAMRYVRSQAHRSSSYYDSVMGRHIYARGRAIAIAPRGGLVWGACIQQYGTADNKIDRLIALVHHTEDQSTDALHEGYTRYLRVWWCDIPARSNGFRLSPKKVIAGEDVSDAWGWKGGDLLDMGVMTPSADASVTVTDPTHNSLKYASAWRFRGDGQRAVCMRDYGSYEDYASLRGEWINARAARTVELTFTIATLPDGNGLLSLNTTTLFHDYGGIGQPDGVPFGRTPLLSNDVLPVDLYAGRAVPIAVDYDDFGNLIFAYAGKIASQDLLSYLPVQGHEDTQEFSRFVYYDYLGTGAEGLVRVTEIQNIVLVGAQFRSATINRSDDPAVVLDVRSGTFAVMVHLPRFMLAQPSNPTGDIVPVPDFPCQQYTATDVDGVLLIRQGEIVDESWYPCPDGSIWGLADLCDEISNPETEPISYFTLAVSGLVQGYYAERFGELVYGYQVAPMPSMSYHFSSPPDPSACGCVPAADAPQVLNLTLDINGPLTPRGGRLFSTVALPSHDWSGFVKVV